jgi:hypothetical protein
MAAALDALLRIKAQVTGAPAVQALGGAIGGVQKQAAGAVGALRRMGAASGGLGGALGALTPLLSAAGLGAMAMNAINAGDAMFDMSQRTGVSVEMLGKFDKAAKMSGTSIEAVGTGLARLARSMAAAAGGGFGEKTKEEMDQAKDAIEQGEKAAVRAVERGADRRMDVLDRETGRRLDKLAKRYRREEQLLNDSFDDQAAAADEAAQDQTDAQIKAIDRLFEARRKAVQNDKALSEASQSALLQQLEDQRDAELEVVRDAATKAQTIRQRASRDARQEVLDGLDERRKAEEDALKASTESQKDAIKEATRSQVESIKEVADQQKKAIGGDTSEQAEQLDALGLSGKGASDAFRELGVTIKNNDGTMRSSDAVLLDISRKFATMPDGVAKTVLAMKLFGRGGVELIPMLNMGGDAIERLKSKMTTEFAAAADQYGDKLVILGGRIGKVGFEIAEALLPTIEAITDKLTEFFGWLDQQDPATQGLITNLLIAAIAFAALAPTILGVIGLITTLTPIVAGIASGFMYVVGVIGLVVAAIASVGAAPIIIVAAIAAAVAAVVAGVVLFHKEIGDFFVWLGNAAMEGWRQLTAPVQPLVDALVGYWTGAATVFYQLFIEPIVKSSQYLWGLITQGWNAVSGVASRIFTAIANAYQNIVVKPLVGAWTKIVDTAKAALRGLLGWAASAINGVINMVNRIIDGINAVRRLAGLSTFGRVGNVTVPAFAQGGYVTAPTVGLVGEAGREYIVPESKAAGFANNIMAGRRGAAAIPSGTSSSGGGAVSINITTGPVRQDASGQRWMTIEDGEKMVRQAVGQMQRTSRTPGGRYSAGVR